MTHISHQGYLSYPRFRLSSLCQLHRSLGSRHGPTSVLPQRSPNLRTSIPSTATAIVISPRRPGGGGVNSYSICFHSFYAEDVRAGPGVRSRSLGAAPRGVWTLDCSTGLCGHCHDKTATVARSPRHCTAEGAPWTERRVAHTGAAIMDCPAVHAGCHPGCLATCCCTLPP